MNHRHGLPDALSKTLRRSFCCQICDAPVPAPIRVENKDKHVWDCDACGPYRMTGHVGLRLKGIVETDPDIRSRLVRWIAGQRICPEITLATIEYCELRRENNPD